MIDLAFNVHNFGINIWTSYVWKILTYDMVLSVIEEKLLGLFLHTLLNA